MSRIIVFGGSGFVGQALLKAALAEQFQVVSISRSGKPISNEPWMDQVEWLSADVFDPKKWAEVIQPKDYVIDSIGILFEKKAQGITYEKFHYQAAKLISEVAAKNKSRGLVYISAAIGLPFFSGYLTQKIRAEKIVRKNFPSALIVKPNFIYGEQRKGTAAIAKLIRLMKKIPLINYFFRKLQPEKVDTVANEVIHLLLENKDTK